MGRKKFTISSFICTNCKKEGIPLPRHIGSQRQKEHLKNMYCIHCKEKHNHIEIRECDRNELYA